VYVPPSYKAQDDDQGQKTTGRDDDADGGMMAAMKGLKVRTMTTFVANRRDDGRG
jgi:hypothetical protein